MRTLLLSCAWMIIFVETVAVTQVIYAQSACPNANFSNGNFNAWQGSTGTYTNPGQTPGIIPGRHTVFTAPFIDPNTCGGLNVIPPGETSSARLGNALTGAQSERLLYGMTVSAQNALFIYKYAVVLENPAGHAPNEQPEFSARVLDALGNPIGGPCGTYTVYGGQPGQNFQTCGGVTWLPWTTVGIDLTPFLGQTVFIEFTTKDCSLSGHFGYAYISANCAPLQLNLDFCAGDSQITLSAPNGFQQYTWNPGNISGQTVTIPTPALGTIFTCTMATFSNQGNCSVDVDVTIQPIQVTAQFPDGAACEGSNLLFLDSSSVSSGVITNWNWDFGDGAQSTNQFPSHAFGSDGNYQVTLIATSDAGCSDTAVQNITIYDLPQVGFTSTGVCSNDTVLFTNLTTDPFPLIYNWDFGDNSQSTDISPYHLYAQQNTYSVMLTATNSMGCIGILTQQTTIFPPPNVDAGPDQNVCINNSISVSAIGANVYTWNNGIQNGISFTPSVSDYYNVTGIDNNGCLAIDSLMITILPNPLIEAGTPLTICFNDQATLTATGAMQYQWNNGIQNGISFTPNLGTTTFTVLGTDANGCIGIDSVTILVNPLPVVFAGIDDTICFNQTITLSGSGALSYLWSNGIVDGVSFTPPIGSSTFTVTGTDAHGCAATDQVSVLVNPLPLVDAGNPQTICETNSVTLTGSGASTYTWSNGVVNGLSFIPVGAGYYTVTGTDVNGCENSDSVLVDFFLQPTVDAGPDITVCSTNFVTLSGTGTLQYQWTNGVQNGVAFVPSVGTTMYTVTGTDANGCTDTDDVTIITYDLPTIDAGPNQTICANSYVTLSGTGGTTYNWSNGIQNNVAFSPLTTSIYTVIGTDANGCINTDSVLVAIENAPNLNAEFSASSGCLPLYVQFTNNAGSSNNCIWSLSSGETLTGCNTGFTFTTEGCFDVTLTSTSTLGCVYDSTYSQVICTYPSPHASFQPNPYFMSELDPTTTMQNSSIGAVNYAWDFGDGNFSTEENPTHTYSENIAAYEIVLTAISEHGCIDTAVSIVAVEEELIYYVPNTFTPDGDGTNDGFKPVIESGFDPNTYRFYIYNRWGQLVFESHDIEEGWNGTFNGLVAQDGTYTWKIEFHSRARGKNDQVVTGHVNILK